MSAASNFPPGLTREDMDHIEGVVRCKECGLDITRALGYDEEGEEITRCPGGCPVPEYEDFE
jgi:hypothetical protein